MAGTDSDVADAWFEYDRSDRQVAAQHARAQGKHELPREIARGYIVLGEKRIGRLASQPRLAPDPSLHVACYHHSCCQAWIPLKRIPDTRLCRIWMAKASEYPDATAHWEAGLRSLWGGCWVGVTSDDICLVSVVGCWVGVAKRGIRETRDAWFYADVINYISER